MADAYTVTTLAPPASPRPRVTRGATAPAAEWLEHAAMLAVVVAWGWTLTRGIGGRDATASLVAVSVFLPTLLILRPWRLSWRSQLVTGWIGLAALIVCAVSPTGWSGTDVAAGYVLAAAGYLTVRSYTRLPSRVEIVVAAVCLVATAQFATAFLPWWGGKDSRLPMVGTFYWYNPYAAFLLPGALLGLALVLQNRRPSRLVGWVAAPLCTAGVVFSSSRATLATLVVGWLAVVAVGARSRPTVRLATVVTGVTLAVIFVLPGPPFFPHWHQPLASAAARAATGQTLAQNGAYRTEFWREAWQVFLHHPLSGSGFHGLATASRLYTPGGWARSQLAHNGLLQALSDGGLLLGLPIVLVSALGVWWSVRSVWVHRATRAVAGDPVRAALGVTLLGALAHSLVDFDWSHSAVLVEAALLLACITPTARPPADRRAVTWQRPAVALVLGCLIVTLPALVSWRQMRSAATDYADRNRTDAQVLAVSGQPFGDYRPALVVLNRAIATRQPVAAVRAAVRTTADEASVDVHTALLRDQVLAKYQLATDAVSEAQALVNRLPGDTAADVAELAAVYAAAGEDTTAERLLRGDLHQQFVSGEAGESVSTDLAEWASDLGTGPAYACLLQRVSRLADAPASTSFPPATARCPR